MQDLISELKARVNTDEVADLLCELVSIPSVNPPGDEEKVATFVRDWLVDQGVESQLVPVSPGRPNVLGRVKFAKPGPTFIFNTHMDVVPVGSGWTMDPFRPERRNGEIYGRGSADAKGPLSGMMVATALLNQMKDRFAGEIILQAVVDEEVSSMGTRALMADLHADMAVVGEPTGGRICIAHKGTCRVLLVIRGKTAHAAEPAMGINAIEGAADLIHEIKQYQERLNGRRHRVCGSPTAVVTIIQGGIKGNMIPDRCELQLSRRLIPGETQDIVASELQQVFADIKRRNPQFDAVVEKFFQTSGGPSETPEDHPFVQLAKNAARSVTGNDVPVGGLSVNCDMAQLRGIAGIPCIVLGPGPTSIAHQPDEHVSIEQLGSVTATYAAIAASALQPPR